MSLWKVLELWWDNLSEFLKRRESSLLRWHKVGETFHYSEKYALKYWLRKKNCLKQNWIVNKAWCFKKEIWLYFVNPASLLVVLLCYIFILLFNPIVGWVGKSISTAKTECLPKRDIIRIKYLWYFVVRIASIPIIHTCVLESTGC